MWYGNHERKRSKFKRAINQTPELLTPHIGFHADIHGGYGAPCLDTRYNQVSKRAPAWFAGLVESMSWHAPDSLALPAVKEGKSGKYSFWTPPSCCRNDVDVVRAALEWRRLARHEKKSRARAYDKVMEALWHRACARWGVVPADALGTFQDPETGLDGMFKLVDLQAIVKGGEIISSSDLTEGDVRRMVAWVKFEGREALLYDTRKTIQARRTMVDTIASELGVVVVDYDASGTITILSEDGEKTREGRITILNAFMFDMIAKHYYSSMSEVEPYIKVEWLD